MKLALALLLFCNIAQADMFYADKEIEITLYNEQCSSDLPALKLAKAEPPDHSGKTIACWWLGDNKTYVIAIDRGEGNGSYYQYDIYRDKFKLIEE